MEIDIYIRFEHNRYCQPIWGNPFAVVGVRPERDAAPGLFFLRVPRNSPYPLRAHHQNRG
ncbi:hypothetical protein [Sphingomonas sp.]|uniref:hypothetical protein n=1 Tax=Sphingomonas sp. TaxID=28214 RepID=UPI0035A97FF9